MVDKVSLVSGAFGWASRRWSDWCGEETPSISSRKFALPLQLFPSLVLFKCLLFIILFVTVLFIRARQVALVVENQWSLLDSLGRGTSGQ